MIAIALVLQLLADPVPSAGVVDSIPPEPHPVQLVSLVGLPRDTAFAGPFETEFRATFASGELPAEHHATGGVWASAPPTPNRFRLAGDDEDRGTWKLEVSIGAPPPASGRRWGLVPDPQGGAHPGWVKTVAPRFRASRGMIVGFTLTVPDPAGRALEPKTMRAAFYFPGEVVERASPAVPTGYKYPWSAAGRTAALVVLDAMHHEAGDLAPAERLDLAPAVRIDAGGEAGEKP